MIGRVRGWLAARMPGWLPGAAALARDLTELGGLGSDYTAETIAKVQHAHRTAAAWVGQPRTSADRALRSGLRAARSASRWAVRTDPFARRMCRILVAGVVGRHGIRLQSRLKLPNGDAWLERNAAIERAWREWSRPGSCSADGRYGWNQLLRALVLGWFRDGEAFVRLLPGFANRFGFALQLIDPDQIPETLNRAPSSSEPELRMGVELDRWNRASAYLILDKHPSDPGGTEQTPRRIAARNVLHYYSADRPGQTRGEPQLLPVLRQLSMIDGYLEAELTAARVEAAKMLFLRYDPEWEPDPNAPQVVRGDTLEIEARPGGVEWLPQGIDPVPWDPQHPTSTGPAFIRTNLQAIASGVDLSYAQVANDLAGVSWSSLREERLHSANAYELLQDDLTELCRRIFLAWLPQAVLTGQIEGVTIGDLDELTDHEWQARGWPWVDPVKESQGDAMAIRLGLNSRSVLAAARGRDFEEVLMDLQREERLAAQYGVDLTTDMGQRLGAKDDGEDDDETAGGVGRARAARAVPARGDDSARRNGSDPGAGRDADPLSRRGRPSRL